jgi:hypothetical protein
MVWDKGANAINKFNDWVGTRPYEIIELILAVGILGFGIHLPTPLYKVVSTTTAIGTVSDSYMGRIVLSILYIVPPLFTLAGLCLKRYKRSLAFRSWAALGIFNAYLFVSILRVITQGWIPVIWIFLLALSLIAGVIHLRLQYERKVLNNGNSD